jgi:hypothetical protein
VGALIESGGMTTGIVVPDGDVDDAPTGSFVA